MNSVRIVWALLTKHMYITRKSFDRLADLFFWPVITLLIWGFLADFLNADYEINLGALLLMGFIFFSFFERGQRDIAVYLLNDFWSDNLQNVYSTPVTHWHMLISLIIFALIRAVFAFIITIFVALVLFQYNLLTIPPLYFGAYMLALSLFAAALGIFLAGIVFRYGMDFQVLVWSVAALLQPIMAVFYPVTILPVWLQYIAKMVPATYVFEGLRQIRLTGVFDSSSFLYSILLDIILIAIACFFYSVEFF